MNHLEYLFGLEQFGIKLGLDNIRAILARLEHPEQAFQSVHVGGTNGKGSVTAMIDTGLRAAGYRVGRYTSPHLVDLTERFVLDGRPIASEQLIDVIGTVRSVVDDLRGEGVLDVQPTFFEVTTAAAFESFRRAAVDVAVVEVGLGGRLDSTNVLTPTVTAITSIAFDHQLYLGSTLRAIALEKAGIIKPAVPVVLGDLADEPLTAIEEVARARGAPIVRATVDDVGDRRVALRGRHQRINAAIALRVLDQLAAHGFTVPPAARDAAVERVEWPGRLDLRRLADGRELLLDAAHNTAGAEALAAYLRSEGMRWPLVFAAMRDKDAAGMFRAVLPAVTSLIVTRSTNQRSAEPADLATAAQTAFPTLPVAIEPVLAAALARAWSESPRIVVAGSIFLLGDVMQRLGLH